MNTLKRSQKLLHERKQRDGLAAMLPIQERYKLILSARETKLEAMRKMKEEAEYMRDPENFEPSFRPDTTLSQQLVKGR